MKSGTFGTLYWADLGAAVLISDGTSHVAFKKVDIKEVVLKVAVPRSTMLSLFVEFGAERKPWVFQDVVKVDISLDAVRDFYQVFFG